MLAITPLVLWGLGFDNPQANWHYILFMIIAVGIFYFKPIGRITFFWFRCILFCLIAIVGLMESYTSASRIW